RKGRQLALGYVVAPALDHLQCAVLLEDDRRGLGMLLVLLAIGRGHGRDESIDVTHRDSLLSDHRTRRTLSSSRSRPAPVDSAGAIPRKIRPNLLEGLSLAHSHAPRLTRRVMGRWAGRRRAAPLASTSHLPGASTSPPTLRTGLARVRRTRSGSDR